MLSLRKSGSPNLNLQPGSTVQQPEVLSKVPETVRNVVKLIIIRKTHVKSRRGHTWSGFAKPEVVLYFGLLLEKSTVGVTELEKRVAAIFLLPVWPLEPPGGSFLFYSGLYCRRIAHRRTQMLSIRKPGAPNINLWPGSTIQKPEVLTKVPEMVPNVVKLTVIRKTLVKSRRGQTWSWFAKPDVVMYFGLLLDKLKVGVAESEKRVAAIFLLPVLPLEPPDALLCLILACIVAVSHIDG